MSVTTQKVFLRGAVILAGAGAMTNVGGWARSPAAAPVPATEGRSAAQTLETVRGELAVARLQLQRGDAIMGFSARYEIPADLAAAIYDAALAEGVEPSLAFSLVDVESNFTPTAKSAAGAVGYTQILPSTARLYEPGLTERQLYDRRTNLRLGFRYLRDLLERYDGTPESTLRLALLAYNRGPARVQELLDAGRDPQNGYSTSVLKGYRR